jgi:hypothetical protein
MLLDGVVTDAELDSYLLCCFPLQKTHETQALPLGEMRQIGSRRLKDRASAV